jgi:hypothetical protein
MEPPRPPATDLSDYRERTAGRAGARRAARAVAEVAELRDHYATAAAPATPDRPFHRTVATVLSRADRVRPRDTATWERFVRLLDRHRDHPRAATNCGVLANLIGISSFGDAADFVVLTDLSGRLGAPRLASVQHRTARFVEPDPSYPVTTRVLHRMIAASAHPVAGGSLDSAVALLAEGVDPDAFLPVVRTAPELRGLVEGGSVLEWRHHLAMIAASPWSPYSQHLVELAEAIDRPLAGEVVARYTALCRDRLKESEREHVADEVRRLVHASGVSQRQFAEWIGTSAPRLSTYVSGAVTPSAALMLRIARASRLLQERDVRDAPSAGSEQSWGAARATADGDTTGRSHLSVV